MEKSKIQLKIEKLEDKRQKKVDSVRATLIYDLSGDIEELDLLWDNECYLSSGRCNLNDIDFSDFKYFEWNFTFT